MPAAALHGKQRAQVAAGRQAYRNSNEPAREASQRAHCGRDGSRCGDAFALVCCLFEASALSLSLSLSSDRPASVSGTENSQPQTSQTPGLQTLYTHLIPASSKEVVVLVLLTWVDGVWL